MVSISRQVGNQQVLDTGTLLAFSSGGTCGPTYELMAMLYGVCRGRPERWIRVGVPIWAFMSRMLDTPFYLRNAILTSYSLLFETVLPEYHDPMTVARLMNHVIIKLISADSRHTLIFYVNESDITSAVWPLWPNYISKFITLLIIDSHGKKNKKRSVEWFTVTYKINQALKVICLCMLTTQTDLTLS